MVLHLTNTLCVSLNNDVVVLMSMDVVERTVTYCSTRYRIEDGRTNKVGDLQASMVIADPKYGNFFDGWIGITAVALVLLSKDRMCNIPISGWITEVGNNHAPRFIVEQVVLKSFRNVLSGNGIDASVVNRRRVRFHPYSGNQFNAVVITNL